MRALYLFLLLFPAVTFAQTDALPVNDQGKIEFSQIVPVENTTSEQLYSRGKLFMAKAFKSGKEVTQLNDEGAKQIVGKGTMKAWVKNPFNKNKLMECGWVLFTITVQAKDNKYRYFITDFKHENPGTKGSYDGGSLENEKPACGTFYCTKKMWKDIKDNTTVSVAAMVKELNAYMTGNTVQSSDNW